MSLLQPGLERRIFKRDLLHIKDVMLNSALMLLVNPLMVFSGLNVYSYFK